MAQTKALCAMHYLAKPSNTDYIETTFKITVNDDEVQVSARKISSIKTLVWKRIHETLMETSFNIFEAAHRLGLHSRAPELTLDKQRME